MSAWMFLPLRACIASASYSDYTVRNRFKYVINAAGFRVSFYTECIVWMWISGTRGKLVRVCFRTALRTALSRQMNQSFLDKVIPPPHLWWRCIRKCTRDSWSASKLICAFKHLQCLRLHLLNTAWYSFCSSGLKKKGDAMDSVQNVTWQ